MTKLSDYMDLLNKTYDEAVDILLTKYGPAEDDYFREKSYYRFLNGEIKNITKGKFTRTSEGLYCHHIDEKKELKISDPLFVKKYNIPFDYQRKDRLVYCDLIEHAILHALITEETSHEFGYPGYGAYLKPMIEEWYLDKEIPNTKWMKHCYDKSYLNPEQAFDILKAMQTRIGENYYNYISEYYEEIERAEQERQEWMENRKREAEEEWNNLIKSSKELHEKSSRKDIVYTYYRLKYDKPANVFNIGSEKTYEEFDKEMKQYPKDEILGNIKAYVNDISDE